VLELRRETDRSWPPKESEQRKQPVPPHRQTCRLIFMLVLTAGFFVAELVSGYVGNSIALVSDSFSMLSDLIALCVGITTGRVSRRRRRRPGASFGYSRAEVVGALSNAVFLAALYFTILVEALQRLASPQPIRDVELVLIVGALGLGVNVVGHKIFIKNHPHESDQVVDSLCVNLCNLCR
uniref:Cation efflux protein transmembrane domain-containing protein n=1 Tax=Salvator merianae TaxID=96440 RepID=A0A8D0E0F4_SALMN